MEDFQARLKEALKLGFKRAILPAKTATDGLTLESIATLADLAARFDLPETASRHAGDS